MLAVIGTLSWRLSTSLCEGARGKGRDTSWPQVGPRGWGGQRWPYVAVDA